MRKVNMECPYCDGYLMPGKTSYTINRRGYHLIIDDVPAYICEQCGKPLFTEEAVQLVQQMLQDLDLHRHELSMIAVPA